MDPNRSAVRLAFIGRHLWSTNGRETQSGVSVRSNWAKAPGLGEAEVAEGPDVVLSSHRRTRCTVFQPKLRKKKKKRKDNEKITRKGV